MKSLVITTVLSLALPLAVPVAVTLGGCATGAEGQDATGAGAAAAGSATGASSAAADATLAAPLVYEPLAGPGGGRHIVLIAGDEEYRSEEALPQLARILAQRHGFRCTVLFSINPQDGTIDPEARGNIPGLSALDDADLLVLFTRFRCLSDADMAHIVNFVNSHRPVIGLRTATHAFAYEPGSTSPFADWSWDAGENTPWPGGFGRQVLGETWVAHRGDHGSESTRGVIPPAARNHMILRGVSDVWGPTDVYAIRELPHDATVLLEGAVLAGMSSDAQPVTDERNDPRTPITWIREIPLPAGGAQRVVCSTIGAAVDLQSEDLRRLLVNACYWCVGLGQEIPERSNVDIVGTYEPTMFGFGGWKHGVRPADLRLGN